MDHECIVVGLLGIDKYEYIMYLSRVLYNLRKKVLIVERAQTGALMSCIPMPDGIENVVIDYRGVYFIDERNENGGKPHSVDEEKGKDYTYDCVLVDYGIFAKESDLKNCDRIIYVVDQKLHNIERISEFHPPEEIIKSLIIKDVIDHKITPRCIAEQLSFKNLYEKQIYVIYQDELDSKCRIECQYDGVFNFRKLSIQAKRAIKGLTTEIYPNITKKELDGAYKRAEKGA